MTHDELQELLPAYALDALPEAEETEMRAHLESCPSCSALLGEHLETAGRLALAAAPAVPSPDLRARVLAEAVRTGQVVPAAPAPARRLPWGRVAGLVSAAALAVLGAFSLAAFDRVQDLERRSDEQRRVLAVLVAPSGTFAMAPTGELPGAGGQVFIGPDGRSAAVIVTGLPDPGEEVYQLWLIRDGRPVPLGAVDPEGGAAAVYVPAGLRPGETMAVTREPNAGNTAPRGPVVLQVV